MPVLPLVERLTAEGSGLAGEPGVSYLIRAGGTRVLPGSAAGRTRLWPATPGTDLSDSSAR